MNIVVLNYATGDVDYISNLPEGLQIDAIDSILEQMYHYSEISWMTVDNLKVNNYTYNRKTGEFENV